MHKGKWQAELMHDNVIVAVLEFDDDYLVNVVRAYDLSHAPIGCVMGERLDIKSLRAWFDTRRIPDRRENLRQLLQVEGFSSAMDAMLSNHAVSMTDMWWVRDFGSSMSWSDVDPRNQHLFAKHVNATFSTGGATSKWWDVTLFGKSKMTKLSLPGLSQQAANEVIAYKLCKVLGISCVEYHLMHKWGRYGVWCPPMLDSGEELVFAGDILKERRVPLARADDAMRFYMDEMTAHGLDAAAAIGEMVLVDILMRNGDRRWDNFGIIRDAKTFEWLRAAPIFDEGDSLWLAEKPDLQEKTNKLNRHRLSDDVKHVAQSMLDYEDEIRTLPDIVDSCLKAIHEDTSRRESVVMTTELRCDIVFGIAKGTEDIMGNVHCL